MIEKQKNLNSSLRIDSIAVKGEEIEVDGEKKQMSKVSVQLGGQQKYGSDITLHAFAFQYMPRHLE